ncbi:hypothetical protein EDC96DRAFT_35263 [Choanephora cucurbitarum]|nr:hypothetical protein EDC96DRAFT_35263 [Choanephora cucurbitarum]
MRFRRMHHQPLLCFLSFFFLLNLLLLMEMSLKETHDANTENNGFEDAGLLISQSANGRRHNEQEIAPLLTSYSRNSMSEPLLSDEDEESITDGLKSTSSLLTFKSRCGAVQSWFGTNAHYYQNEKGERRAILLLFQSKEDLPSDVHP